MASTYLSRTPGGNYYLKATFSFWFKRSGLGEMGLFGRKGSNSTVNLSTCHFGSSDDLLINFRDSGGTSQYYQITNRKFRDTTAWYHFHYIIEGDNSTQGDRSRMYINGVRETDFALNNNPSSNSYQVATFLSSDGAFTVGRALRSQTDTFGNFNGSISHFHCSTGYAYEPTVFGETDATTGEWKIKTDPTFTPGTDGFTILKDGMTITDQSANSNNFSLTAGTLMKSEDCPSNVFCTNNVNWKQESTRYLTHSVGATMISGAGSSTWYQTPGTLAFNKGKFYWECKFNASTNLDKNTAGVIDYQKTQEDGQFQDATGSVFYKNEDGGETRIDGSTSSADYGTLAQNDILGVAVDMDAATPTVKFYKNGSLLVTASAASLSGKYVTPAQTVYTSGEYQVNYGNGYFGTTAISSAGTNASNLGLFEYNVPSGYSALCTRGLNL